MYIYFNKTREVKTPQRATVKSAGIDFYVPDDFNDGQAKLIHPQWDINIPSGIKMKIPSGHCLIALNKSGVALKKGLAVGACLIDEDYQGEIHLHVYNFSNESVYVHPGEKLVQFALVPVLNYQPRELEKPLWPEQTERGEGGFGSTGT